MNAIIQPIHLLLYTALVGSSIALAVKNPIYAIVAIAFMIPAEKFIKKMFGINSETTAGMGAFASGALAMTGLQKLAGMGKKLPTKAGGAGTSESSKDADSGNDTIRTFNKEAIGSPLDAFNGDKKDSNDKSFMDKLSDNKEKMDEIQKAVNSEYGLDENGRAVRPNGIEIDNIEATRREKAAQKEVQRRIEQYRQEHQEEQEDKQEELKAQDGWQRRYLANRVKAMAPTALKAAKGTARMATKTAGTLAGATIGLAAGASTGDASKAISSMIAGGAAGNAIGGNVSNLAGIAGAGLMSMPGKFERRNEEIEYMKDEAKYGAEVARQRRVQKNNKEAERQFLDNKKEQKKWEDVKGEVGYEGSTKDLMKVVSNYKRAGVKDDDMIKNALKVEKENGGIGGASHEKVKGIASFATKNNFDQTYVTDSDKRKNMKNVLGGKIKNEKDQKEAMQLFAELHGLGDMKGL